MGGLMLVAFLFVLKSGPLPQRIGIGLFYGLAFIPLTYWIDRTAHRTAGLADCLTRKQLIKRIAQIIRSTRGKTREAVRQFQSSVGQVPDGFASGAVLERLRGR